MLFSHDKRNYLFSFIEKRNNNGINYHIYEKSRDGLLVYKFKSIVGTYAEKSTKVTR